MHLYSPAMSDELGVEAIFNFSLYAIFSLVIMTIHFFDIVSNAYIIVNS